MSGTVRNSLRLFAAVLALAVITAGCGNGTPSGGSSGPLPPVSSLVAAVYTHVADSGGKSPAKGTVATLMFEPGNVATLYIASETDQLAHHGTWGYSSNQLTLKFTADDFHPDATFALDLSAVDVTMPFQLFSSDKGTSHWKRGSLSLEEESVAVYDAYVNDGDAQAADSVDMDGAVDKAAAYANARMQAGGDQSTDVFPAAAHVGLHGVVADNKPAPTDVKSVEKGKNGLQITLQNGTKEWVELYGWAQPADGQELQGGPLSGDPRVHLNVITGASSANDVQNKNAVFFAPYNHARIYNPLDVLGKWKGSHNASEGFDWDGASATLQKDGFTVDQIVNSGSSFQYWQDKSDMANLIKLIGDLGGKSGKAPGFVVINTHGADNGTLSTGLRIGSVSDGKTKLDASFKADMEKLKAEGYGDLISFNGGTEEAPTTLSRMFIARDYKPGTVDVFLSLTPDFFRWLASKGAKFDQSVFYVAACLTATTDDLQKAVAAGAYFAWKPEVDPHIAGAVFKYLVDDMVRPTHSAEEAYYNIIRVQVTHQMVYKEDTDLQATLPVSDKFPLLQNLVGVGYAGDTGVTYQEHGFLNRDTDPGQIWWLLFASRWGQDADGGSANLKGCWDAWWSQGKNGGIESPGCNASDTGSPPKQDEVAYASYLLGRPVLDYSKEPVPRITLNDAKAG